MTESSGQPPLRELCVVMPVHNEAGCVADVLGEWSTMFEGLGIDYVWAIVDDGSRDATPQVLAELQQANPCIMVWSQPQSGHGAAVMAGYRRAVGLARWVLQIDSDGELRSERFGKFWRTRAEHDLLLGRRNQRGAPAMRKMMTKGARLALRCLFGSRLKDTNVPFRLVRAERLESALRLLPMQAQAPNVLLSGLSARLGWRVTTLKVKSYPRAAGVSTLRPVRLLKLGARAAAQTVGLAWKTRRL